MIAKKTLLPILVAVLLAFAMMPISMIESYAETEDSVPTGVVKDGALDGIKVRIRPTGSFKPLSINQDGSGNQNCVHLYYQGKSSQFYKASGTKTVTFKVRLK